MNHLAPNPEDELSLQSPKGIQSIEIGYRILHALERAPGPLALKNIAARAGMSASKARFYLNSLMRCGLVVQASAGGVYDLGPSALRIGIAALSHLDVMRVSQDALFDLSEETGRSVFLSVWANRGATVVYRVEGQQGSPLEVRLGTVQPYMSATSRALLASFPIAVARRLLDDELASARPGDPISDLTVDEMLGRLDDVRTNGVAVGDGLTLPGSGLRGIAAAVRDHTGSGCVAITVSSLRHARSSEQDRICGALRRIVDQISEDIGATKRPRSSTH
jgi:DNA-binding IclR family transcriptional regulator